jgi:hypothetical protein
MKGLRALPGAGYWARSPWHAAFTLVMALTLLRVIVLFYSMLNLGPDEAQYWSWSESLDFGYFSKPPMIAWVIAFTTSIFGDSEPMVRLSSPLIHAATAMVLFALGKDLYDERTGFWVAATYITLPAVFFSSGLITTDVPLLFYWSCALFGLNRVLKTKQMAYAVLTGLAIGLGFMSKYAMVYFLLCGLVFLLPSKTHRWLFWSRQGAVILLLTILCILPNIYWNAKWGFPTFTHTAANANWQGDMFNFDKMAGFVGSQFGVFGPILFGLLIFGAAKTFLSKQTGPSPHRSSDLFLLSFCLPILFVAITQSFLSRANANWAATAYIASTLFVAAWTLRQNWRPLLAGSAALHCAIGAFLYVLITVPGTIEATGMSNSFKRVREWDTMGERILAAAAEAPYQAIMGDDRLVTAELLYYVRPRSTDIAQWEDDGHITHHYELTIPLSDSQGRAVLLVSKKRDPQSILQSFERASFIEEVHVITGINKSRTLYLFSLQGYKGQRELPQ